MKLTVSTKALKSEINEALPFAKGAVGLSICVRLKLEGNSLDIRARNSSGAYIGKIEVAGEKDGCIAINADKLSGILATIPEGELSIQSDKEGKVSVSQGRIKYELGTINPEKHFDMEIPENWQNLEDGYIPAISKVLYAASTDSSKPSLCGVCVCRHDEKMDIVATDGRVLAIVSSMAEKVEEEKKYVLPSSFMNMIVKKNVSKIFNDEKVVWFSDGVRCYVSSLVKNEFPPYQRVIPAPDTYKAISIDRRALESAIKRMAVVVDSKSNRVMFDIVNNTVHLHTEDNANGTAEDYVECEQEEGQNFEAAFDYRYLLQPLSVSKSERIDFSYNVSEEKKGGPITITGSSDPDWKAVIMPMNR